jgi:hypothetical protein
MALLAALLAGCKITLTAPDATSAPGPPGPAPARSGSLITEPGAGFWPVYRLIKHARHSIDMTMFEFADTKAEHDLAVAARRGVRVRVVLDQREKSTNTGAYQYLRAHGVKVVWSSSTYTYTHQKTLVIDRSKAVIMTANLTARYYPTTRDFLVVDSRRADVTAIVKVFNADYAHRPVHPGDGRDLVWSPTDSQEKLLALIDGATGSLRIYSEEMGDTTMEDALIAAAKRGVSVRICGENQGGEFDSDFARLARARGAHQLLPFLQRLLHPREDHRGRLRHAACEGVHRVGEPLQYLTQPEPRARADDGQPCGHVLDRQNLHDRLPQREALVPGRGGIARTRTVSSAVPAGRPSPAGLVQQPYQARLRQLARGVVPVPGPGIHRGRNQQAAAAQLRSTLADSPDRAETHRWPAARPPAHPGVSPAGKVKPARRRPFPSPGPLPPLPWPGPRVLDCPVAAVRAAVRRAGNPGRLPEH